MLNALVHVLAQIDGVVLVRRGQLEEALLSDGQMPAILIAEGLTTYTPETRHAGVRTYDVISTLTLDIQVRTQKRTGDIDHQASMLREALVDQVINVLANNPMLLCQLPEEDEDTEHCYDALFGACRVTYPPSESGYANALLTHQVKQCVKYDTRKRTKWKELISAFRKWTKSESPTPNEPQPIELDIQTRE